MNFKRMWTRAIIVAVPTAVLYTWLGWPLILVAAIAGGVVWVVLGSMKE